MWHSFLLYKCIPCFKGKTHRTNSRNGFESAFFRFLTFAKVAITYVTHFARSLVGVHFPNQIICLSDRHTKNSIGIVECFQFCSFRKNSQNARLQWNLALVFSGCGDHISWMKQLTKTPILPNGCFCHGCKFYHSKIEK